MSTKPDPARERLTRLMNERRRELGRRRRKNLSWDEVAALADVSRQTLQNLRNGESGLRDTTKDGVEDALQWGRGSVDAILAGGDPLVPGGQAASDPSAVDRLYEKVTGDQGRREQVQQDSERGEGDRDSPEGDAVEKLERLWRRYRDDPGPRGTTLREMLTTWGERDSG